MTPQLQHCDCERICYLYRDSMLARSRKTPCRISPCNNDTRRSRPAPSAPEYTLEEVIKIDKQIRHAQQVAAAQARNETLGEILQKFSDIVLNGDCPYKYNCRNETHCEICQLKFVIESLRPEVP